MADWITRGSGKSDESLRNVLGLASSVMQYGKMRRDADLHDLQRRIYELDLVKKESEAEGSRIMGQFYHGSSGSAAPDASAARAPSSLQALGIQPMAVPGPEGGAPVARGLAGAIQAGVSSRGKLAEITAGMDLPEVSAETPPAGGLPLGKATLGIYAAAENVVAEQQDRRKRVENSEAFQNASPHARRYVMESMQKEELAELASNNATREFLMGGINHSFLHAQLLVSHANARFEMGDTEDGIKLAMEAAALLPGSERYSVDRDGNVVVYDNLTGKERQVGLNLNNPDDLFRFRQIITGLAADREKYGSLAVKDHTLRRQENGDALFRAIPMYGKDGKRYYIASLWNKNWERETKVYAEFPLPSSQPLTDAQAAALGIDTADVWDILQKRADDTIAHDRQLISDDPHSWAEEHITPLEKTIYDLAERLSEQTGGLASSTRGEMKKAITTHNEYVRRYNKVVGSLDEKYFRLTADQMMRVATDITESSGGKVKLPAARAMVQGFLDDLYTSEMNRRGLLNEIDLKRFPDQEQIAARRRDMDDLAAVGLASLERLEALPFIPEAMKSRLELAWKMHDHESDRGRKEALLIRASGMTTDVIECLDNPEAKMDEMKHELAMKRAMLLVFKGTPHERAVQEEYDLIKQRYQEFSMLVGQIEKGKTAYDIRQFKDFPERFPDIVPRFSGLGGP